MICFRFSPTSGACAVFASSLLLVGSALALSPADLSGRPPAFEKGKTGGAAVYTEREKLHVLFTGNDKSQLFRGKLCSKSGISGLTPTALEGNDEVKLSPEGKCVWFKFQTGAEFDGFQIDLPKDLTFFEARRGRQSLAGKEVWLGQKGLHPKQTPFSFTGR